MNRNRIYYIAPFTGAVKLATTTLCTEKRLRFEGKTCPMQNASPKFVYMFRLAVSVICHTCIGVSAGKPLKSRGYMESGSLCLFFTIKLDVSKRETLFVNLQLRTKELQSITNLFFSQHRTNILLTSAIQKLCLSWVVGNLTLLQDSCLERYCVLINRSL